uniref:Attacin n=1 Tax=Oryctes rhinoceros TaxID=72550 RepID=A0A6B9EXB9_ORYRH|nr:attacin [Oryctes rhinoceros]
MYSASIIFLCLILNTLAYPVDVIEDRSGQAFALVPLSRVRRAEAYGNVDVTNPGTAILGVKGTPIDNENHRLDANAFASTNIMHHSPISKGLEASYVHKPTGSNLDLSAVNTPGWGTDVTASGKYNFYQDKTSSASLGGFYSRHYSGMPGTLKPDYGIMLNYRGTF